MISGLIGDNVTMATGAGGKLLLKGGWYLLNGQDKINAV
jgi:nitrogen fixation protein